MAKATKNGDQAAEDTIPRMTASAAARRLDAAASSGSAADISAKAPVLMMPPKTCAASCCPPIRARDGKAPRRSWVAWTEGIVIAVALTSAIVGRSAAKISTRLPPATRAPTSGSSSRSNQVTSARTARITIESHLRRATVNRMKRPKAQAPRLATVPSGRAVRIARTAATQAVVRQARRA